MNVQLPSVQNPYHEIERLLQMGDTQRAAWQLQRLYERNYEEAGCPDSLYSAEIVLTYDPENESLRALREKVLLSRLHLAVGQCDLASAVRYRDTIRRSNPHVGDVLVSELIQRIRRAIASYREEEAATLLRYYLWYADSTPSAHHSEILDIALQLFDEKEAWRFLPFCSLWGLGNLREEDWLVGDSSGLGIDEPLAQRAMQRLVELAVMQSWHLEGFPYATLIPHMESAIAHGMTTQNFLLPYARLLVILREFGRAREIFRYLLPELHRELHYWRDYSAAFIPEPEVRIGMLFLALERSSSPLFTGKTRKELSELLWREGYHEAAAEQARGLLVYRDCYNYSLSKATIAQMDFIGAQTAKPGSSEVLAKGFVAQAWEAALRGMRFTPWVVSRIEGEKLLYFQREDGEEIAGEPRLFPQLQGAAVGQPFALSVGRLQEKLPLRVLYIKDGSLGDSASE